MAAYVIFDVDVRDPVRFKDFQTGALPLLEAAGARYLARGGAHQVYEGDWQPNRLVLMEFPSIEAWDAFYHSAAYQDLKAIRDECSSTSRGRGGDLAALSAVFCLTAWRLRPDGGPATPRTAPRGRPTSGRPRARRPWAGPSGCR